jgi:hypothetical protein
MYCICLCPFLDCGCFTEVRFIVRPLCCNSLSKYCCIVVGSSRSYRSSHRAQAQSYGEYDDHLSEETIALLIGQLENAEAIQVRVRVRVRVWDRAKL